MKTPLLRTPLLGLALLAGGLSLSPQAANRAEGVGDPFPLPSAGMTIEAGGEDQDSLKDILLEFGELTGEHLIWDSDHDIVLRACKSGLQRPLEVPPEELYSVIETLLIANHFVFTDLRRGEPRMMAVTSLDSPARSTIRSGATYVTADQFELYEDHPGILITAALKLDRMDVRLMSNSMRVLVVDPNTMQVVPIPESNTLLLTGFAANTVQLARLLLEVNAGTPEPQPIRFPPRDK